MKLRFVSASLLCLALCTPLFAAPVGELIDAHTAQGRTVFVVLTDAAARDLEAARAVARQAQARTPGSAVVELDRSDPEQRAAVARYRVAGAPVPLVLVIARNGLAVGAARPAAPGAVERLVGLVPSPSKAEYLRVLSERRVAMLVFSKRSMQEQGPLFEQISLASRTPKLAMGTVLVDVDDPAEHGWIAQWKLDPAKIERPFLVFVNPKGQVIGNLTGAPTAERIVEMARTKVKGCGCGNPKCKGHK